MMIIVYVDSEKRVAISQAQFDEEVDNAVGEVLEDTALRDEYLYDFLGICGYDIVDCFLMNEGRRGDVMGDFMKWLREELEKIALDEKYDRYEIEV